MGLFQPPIWCVTPFSRQLGVSGWNGATAEFGLLGPNGAGKTTLVRILTGVLRPDEGKAQVAGLDVVRAPHRVKERIGYATQEQSVYRDLTVEESLLFRARLYRPGEAQALAEEALFRFGLRPYAKTLAGHPSGGWRQRLALEAESPGGVVAAIDRGQARVGLVVPPGALEKVRRGESVALQVYVDGADPNFAFQAQAALGKALQEVNARILVSRALAGERGLPPLSLELHTLYNPENKTAWFMIPGIIGLVLTMFTVLLTALSLVREAESRTMESLLASPLRPYEMVLGKVLPYLYRLRGGPFGVGLGALGLRGAGAGEPGASPPGHVPLHPRLLGGGGVHLHPGPHPGAGGLRHLRLRLPHPLPLPARYLIEVLRGVMLKGAGFAVLWPHFLALALFSGQVLFLASARFQRQVAV
mgnify:CR=1 FL=1